MTLCTHRAMKMYFIVAYVCRSKIFPYNHVTEKYFDAAITESCEGQPLVSFEILKNQELIFSPFDFNDNSNSPLHDIDPDIQFCNCWALQTNYFDPTPGIPKNTTQHQDVSFQSTLDRRPMYNSQNGPVESECKLNNVNSLIIRNQYQIQNQREVTLYEDKYCKSCHYQTNTEF